MNQQLRQKYGHDGFEECVDEHQHTVDDATRPERPEQRIAKSRLSILLARLGQFLFPSPAGDEGKAEKLNRNVVDVAPSINFTFIASIVTRCW